MYLIIQLISIANNFSGTTPYCFPVKKQVENNYKDMAFYCRWGRGLIDLFRGAHYVFVTKVNICLQSIYYGHKANVNYKENLMSEFTVTDLAVDKLKEYLAQNNIDSALRVALMQGG